MTLLRDKNSVHLVHALLRRLESSFSSPDNEFSHPFSVIRVGTNVGREDCFDDFGAAGSEIFALANQFINLSCNIFCNGDSELLFCHL